MAKDVHKVYVFFLIAAGLLSTLVIGIHGAGYYTTPLEDRPFHPQYISLKPTGLLGQGYGIIGSLMITVGVILYSSRKRWRALANLGRIKNWLEFHIFLCLLGPILVVYHTTFKIGGLVAVSFWSMAAVVLSGVIGRYFYVQIPKGIHGNELSSQDLVTENERIAETLRKQFGFDADLLKLIEEKPQFTQQAMKGILVAKNLERIADHAGNISTDVIFWIRGADVRHQLSMSMD